MNNNYIIGHLPESCGALPLSGEFHPERIPYPWSDLNTANLDEQPWPTEYQPECHAKVGWNAKGVHVLMYANEPVIKADETRVGGDVYLDSCLEFFLGMDAASYKYVNCESNPLSVMHIGLGTGRYDRQVFRQIPEGFAPTHSDHRGAWWAVSYTIPADFIRAHFGKELSPGMRVRGNFYACGDAERNVHRCMYKGFFGAKPDFHIPQLFADMRLGGVVPENIRDIEPFRLCGNVYFVGTTAVSVHIIDTGAGLIMIDTGYPFMRDAILENMQKLGLRIEDVRYIIHSHGHYDHYGNTEYFKQLSGAKTCISRIDNYILNGTQDLSWADELGFPHIPPFDCDVLIEDGDRISLGNTEIECRLAPGHTAGVLCLFFDIHDGERTLRAAMHGGIGMGSMKKAFLDARGLGYATRRHFREDVVRLKTIPVDVVLGNHPYQNCTEEKRIRLNNGEKDAFVDPTEWAALMDRYARMYDEMIAEEK